MTALRRPAARLALALVGVVAALATAPVAAAEPRWNERLQAEVAAIERQAHLGLGVYVRDLESGISAGWRADERWYLASTIKLPVAIAVLRGVEAGDFTLDTPLTLRASDYVDGAGPTNGLAIGTPLTIRFLLEQMMVHSDNTASDMLIGLVGIARVNAGVESLVPYGFERITSLADVRRLTYGRVLPEATRLEGKDLLLLRQQRSDAERARMLPRLVGASGVHPSAAQLAKAWDDYYASGVNSARLDAYGQLLVLVAAGQALGPAATAQLLALMERSQTGADRIKAGLPPGTRFAHKTGTQRQRFCDSGIVTAPVAGRERRVVVVACVRDEVSATRSDRALRQVGAALCRSGLITEGPAHAPAASLASLAVPVATAPVCDAPAGAGLQPAPLGR